MKPFVPTKLASAITFSEELMLASSHFPMKGHTEVVPLTDEDRAAHARAVAAYEEVMTNEWIELSGWEYDFYVRPFEPRTIFVPEETAYEHMARWVAAGRPMRNPISDAMNAALIERFDRS